MPPPHPYPSKLFPFSLPSLPTILSREILPFYRLYLSLLRFPRLTLPYFCHFFLSYPFLSILLTPLLARSTSSFFLVYLLFTYSVRVISPILLLILIRTQVGVRHAPIVFVSFAFPARPSIETSSPFMRTIITISGAANCN